MTQLWNIIFLQKVDLLRLTGIAVGHEEVECNGDNEGDECCDPVNEEHHNQAQDTTSQTDPQVVVLKIV